MRMKLGPGPLVRFPSTLVPIEKGLLHLLKEIYKGDAISEQLRVGKRCVNMHIFQMHLDLPIDDFLE